MSEPKYSCADFPYGQNIESVSNSNDAVPHCELSGKPISRFYSYRRRYDNIPSCELNYLDEACDDHARVDLPHESYLSDFGLEYEQWKHGMGSSVPRWNHYQDTLFANDKKRSDHPFLYKNKESWAIPVLGDVFGNVLNNTLGSVPGIEGFMGCNANGTSYIGILTLFIIFLLWNTYRS